MRAILVLLLLPAPALAAINLAAVEIAAPGDVMAGDPASATWGVENRGDRTVQARLRWFLSSNETISSRDVELEVLEGGTVAVDPGETVRGTDVIRAPLNHSPGLQFLGLRVAVEGLEDVDPGDDVAITKVYVESPGCRVTPQQGPPRSGVRPVRIELACDREGYVLEAPDEPALELTPSGLEGVVPVSVERVVVQITRAGQVLYRYALALPVPGPSELRVATSGLPEGMKGVPYRTYLRSHGGTAPRTWAVLQGELPPGLALEGEVVLGTPIAAGTRSLIVQVTDTWGDTASGPVEITIDPGVTLLTRELRDAVVNEPYRQELRAADGTTPYAFEAAGLPPGLAIEAATSTSALIRGTPVVTGTSEVVVCAVDAARRDCAALQLAVRPSPLPIEPGTLPVAFIDRDYRVQLGTPAAATFEHLGGTLPAGLELTASGVIRGRPLGPPRTARFLVRASEPGGREGTITCELEVREPPPEGTGAGGEGSGEGGGTAGSPATGGERRTDGCSAGGAASWLALAAAIALTLRGRDRGSGGRDRGR